MAGIFKSHDDCRGSSDPGRLERATNRVLSDASYRPGRVGRVHAECYALFSTAHATAALRARHIGCFQTRNARYVAQSCFNGVLDE